MRILLLTSQLPFPPHSGGPLRVYGLIDGLSRAGYTIDLLTFIDSGQPDPAATPLAERCARIVTVPTPARSGRDRLRDLLLTPHADLARRFYSPGYASALAGMLAAAPYDLIQIESLEMACYLPQIRVGSKAQIVYDAYNAEYALQRLIARVDRGNLSRLPVAAYSLIQSRRLMRFERSVCQGVNCVIAVSDADAEALRALAPHTPIWVVPNAIHTAEYAHSSQTLDLGPAALLFTGTMNYRPNVDAVLWFVEHVLGAVREVVPEARLFVVGNKPHDRLESIRRRTDVEVTGFVQDVRPFLHGAAVYVAPLRMGSGTRLKLLQAMAAGCAIVSTRLGAEGLSVQSGRDIVLADEAEPFIQATAALLRDPAQRKALGTAAQALVRQKYDWSVIMPCLVDVYRDMGIGSL